MAGTGFIVITTSRQGDKLYDLYTKKSCWLFAAGHDHRTGQPAIYHLSFSVIRATINMSKAKRYNPTTQEAVHSIRYGLKGLLLYLLPLPALIASIIALIKGDIIGTLITGGSFAAYMLSAHIARHGFKLEGEYKRRKIARAPRQNTL